MNLVEATGLIVHNIGIGIIAVAADVRGIRGITGQNAAWNNGGRSLFIPGLEIIFPALVDVHGQGRRGVAAVSFRQGAHAVVGHIIVGRDPFRGHPFQHGIPMGAHGKDLMARGHHLPAPAGFPDGGNALPGKKIGVGGKTLALLKDNPVGDCRAAPGRRGGVGFEHSGEGLLGQHRLGVELLGVGIINQGRVPAVGPQVLEGVRGMGHHGGHHRGIGYIVPQGHLFAVTGLGPFNGQDVPGRGIVAGIADHGIVPIGGMGGHPLLGITQKGDLPFGGDPVESVGAVNADDIVPAEGHMVNPAKGMDLARRSQLARLDKEGIELLAVENKDLGIVGPGDLVEQLEILGGIVGGESIGVSLLFPLEEV